MTWRTRRPRGLADTVGASTARSDIDGRAGAVRYRGCDVRQRAGSAIVEDIAYLPQRGAAPVRARARATVSASIFAAPPRTATLPDMRSAVIAAMGRLKGPLRGGANEQVMRMLTEMRAAAPADPVGGAERGVCHGWGVPAGPPLDQR